MICTTSALGQKALIIGIDGCRSDVLEEITTPNLDGLIANGLYSKDCLNDDITISGPGWSAILCGVWSDKHEVYGNDFSTNNYSLYPSLFNRIESFDSDLHTVSICNWSPINTHIVQTDADVIMNAANDNEVATLAIDIIQNSDPDVMFLHFDEADGAGHSTGFSMNSETYVTTLQNIDVLIGDVLDALEQRPNYNSENWAVFVTSDHGGINFSHGGNTIQEQLVPFIISGDSIDHSIIEKDSILLTTSNCLADTEELSFDGLNDHVQFPQISDYDFGANQDFTIECRVRTSQAGDVSILGNKNWQSGTNKGFVFSFKYPSGPEWKVNVGDGTQRVDINTGGQIADNEWHTLSVSFDRDGMMILYEDGVFLDQADISNIGDITVGQGIFLGTDINQNFDFLGSIAEVRLWSVVLSPQEINDWHCQKLTSSHSSYNNLIGYWPMDDNNQVTSLLDLSSNTNNGIISGATWMNSGSTYEYIYDKTPRIADIPLSVLGHMCVPVDTAWQLDGRSWVKDCFWGYPECVNQQTLTWVGNTSQDWHEPDNWDLCRVPLLCDKVFIPTGSNVLVASNLIAECYSLYVESNADFCVSQGAELNVIISD